MESADLETVLLALTATERLRLGLALAALDTMLRFMIAICLCLCVSVSRSTVPAGGERTAGGSVRRQPPRPAAAREAPSGGNRTGPRSSPSLILEDSADPPGENPHGGRDRARRGRASPEPRRLLLVPGTARIHRRGFEGEEQEGAEGGGREYIYPLATYRAASLASKRGSE